MLISFCFSSKLTLFEGVINLMGMILMTERDGASRRRSSGMIWEEGGAPGDHGGVKQTHFCSVWLCNVAYMKSYYCQYYKIVKQSN